MEEQAKKIAASGKNPPSRGSFGRRHQPTGSQGQNVAQIEQWSSLALGGLLAFRGLRKGSLLSLAVGAGLLYRGTTGSCPLYERFGIDTRRESFGTGGRGHHASKSIHINRPPEQLYAFWRNLENLPRVMSHIESVTSLDDKRSLWVARVPFADTIEWEAEVTTERPNELIAWRSRPGSELDCEGAVRFRSPAFGEGTEVFVSMSYLPPGGTIAAKVLKMFRSGLQQQLQEDLRGFKQLMEAGERPRSDPEQSMQVLQ
ncbi:MAG: DUF2892 domain-containing protein [Bdellovibrionales bacterium]|nr:DUF2892 domain-containing protein [Bdellovibrionales bacterium]